MSAIKSDCITTYKASRDSGFRDPAAVKWIILHSTEGGTAKSIAQYFASPTAKGSAHLIVDNYDCYRSLKNDQIPWAAPGANTKGFHIEQCGFARWTSAEWMLNKLTLQRAAYKTAYHCHLFKIPAVWLTAAELSAGKKGISSHFNCTQAFGGGTHWDPGTGWPRTTFMAMVKTYYAELA